MKGCYTPNLNVAKKPTDKPLNSKTCLTPPARQKP